MSKPQGEQASVTTAAERSAENDDLSWARPYVEQARASVAGGEVLTLEVHKTRNATRLASLGAQADN